MATKKAYTDYPQSKVLAKILPPESADMHYNVVGDAVIGDYQSGMSSARSVAKAYKKNPDEFAKNVIPCWSLAALLSVLPDYSLSTNTDGTVFVVCESKKPMISDAYDNPVDACVAMIIKLHELKML